MGVSKWDAAEAEEEQVEVDEVDSRLECDMVAGGGWCRVDPFGLCD